MIVLHIRNDERRSMGRSQCPGLRRALSVVMSDAQGFWVILPPGLQGCGALAHCRQSLTEEAF